ncbi:MAG: phosphate ABC transporter substrate-binding protein PstS [Bacteroidales bacterium]|nr:phosphate ABC transporter substrate-binding protein PstS [Bacteroidales bacterium]
MKKIHLVIIAALLIMTACKQGQQKSGSADSKISITAAGATFPMPFYNQVFSNYQEKTGISITYGGIGSGGGIRSLTDKVVDFGATDAYLSDENLAEMPAEVVHIPTCIGAVVIAYNLPEVPELKLTTTLLEGIFMGKITKWNDAALEENNPGVNLPDKKITVVVRSDGSGTTYIFSDYMSKISEAWEQEVGRGKSLNWPVGMGAKGNPGVAGTIGQTEGSLGYIGSEYAFAQNISFAMLQNAAGNYIKPNAESISAAAKGDIPADTRVMLTNSIDPEAYPISGFTWIILYKEQNYNNRSKEQAMETVKLLEWLVSDEAQQVTKKIHYSPLPERAVVLAKNILSSVTYDGKALLSEK